MSEKNQGILQRLLRSADSEKTRREKIELADSALSRIGIEKKNLNRTLTVSKELATRLNAQKMTEEDIAEMADGSATVVTEALEEMGLLNDDNREQVRGAVGQAIARMMGQMADDAEIVAETDDKMDDDKMDNEEDVEERGITGAVLEEIRKEQTSIREAQTHNYNRLVEDFGDIATALVKLPDVMEKNLEASRNNAKDVADAIKEFNSRIERIEKAFESRPRRASEAPETIISDDDPLKNSTKEAAREEFSQKWGIKLSGDE